MKFKIEQIAIRPKYPIRAKQLLSEIGAVDWSEDHVVATGKVFGEQGTNEADLSFNYEIFDGKEFEILNYTKGRNWIDKTHPEGNVVNILVCIVQQKNLKNGKNFFTREQLKFLKRFLQTHIPILCHSIKGHIIMSYLIQDQCLVWILNLLLG